MLYYKLGGPGPCGPPYSYTYMHYMFAYLQGYAGRVELEKSHQRVDENN